MSLLWQPWLWLHLWLLLIILDNILWLLTVDKKYPPKRLIFNFWSIGEMTKDLFSRLIIELTPKRNVHNFGIHATLENHPVYRICSKTNCYLILSLAYTVGGGRGCIFQFLSAQFNFWKNKVQIPAFYFSIKHASVQKNMKTLECSFYINFIRCKIDVIS